VLARFNDAGNYYYAYIDPGMSEVALYRQSAGVPTRLGAATRTIAPNTYYPLRLLVQGSALKVYFNNEATPAVTATDTAIPSGNFGGIHGYAGGANTVLWDDFNIVAAPPPTPSALFADDFNRTSGLGTNWRIGSGSFTTDGAFAVSGMPPISGNWARIVPSLGTSDYSVTAQLNVPPGSLYSGVVARSSDSVDVDRNLYSALISTDGSVNLYRRNDWSWTHLATAPATITPGTTYTVKLVTTGSSPVHLEVWLGGARQIVFDDASASRLTAGLPAIQNYDANVKYDSFRVDAP
jgi:hypothetical protein